MPFSIHKHRLPFLLLAGLVAGSGLPGCTEDATGPESDALILLTSPKPGENFKVGQTIQVKWTTPKTDPNFPVEEVDIRFSPDSGKLWKSLNGTSITRADGAWGNFTWVIPDSLSYSGIPWILAGKTQCLLRVEQYSAADPKQRSTLSQTFTISAR